MHVEGFLCARSAPAGNCPYLYNTVPIQNLIHNIYICTTQSLFIILSISSNMQSILPAGNCLYLRICPRSALTERSPETYSTLCVENTNLYSVSCLRENVHVCVQEKKKKKKEKEKEKKKKCPCLCTSELYIVPSRCPSICAHKGLLTPARRRCCCHACHRHAVTDGAQLVVARRLL